MIMFLTLTTLFLHASVALASPLVPRIVFNPKITAPDASAVWDVGTTQTVKWDPTGLPLDTLTGQVVLGHIEDSDPFNEHLILNPPLAKGFLIKDGEVSITIPNVPSRKDYIVVVFGDSGNASPRFTINNPNSSGNSTSTSTSTNASTSTSSGTAVAAGTSTTAGGSLPSTTISDPIPITGSTITGNPSTLTEPTTPVSPISTLPTSTAPTTPTTTAASTSGTSTGSTTSSATGANGTSAGSTGSDNNAAGKLTIRESYPLIALSFILSVFIL